MYKRLLTGSLIAAVAIGGYLLADKKINETVKTHFDAYLKQTTQNGELAKVSYDSITANLLGQASIFNLEITPAGSQKSITIERIEVTEFDREHEIPHFLDVKLDGLILPVNVQDEVINSSSLFVEYVETLGYTNQLPLSARVRYDYEDDAEQNYRSILSLFLVDVGHAEISLHTQEIPLKVLVDTRANEDDKNENPLESFRQGKIPKVRVRYSDIGAIKEMTRIAAKQSNETEDAIRAQINAALANNSKLIFPTNLNPFRTQLLASMETFIKGGNSLTFNIEPQHKGDITTLEPLINKAMSQQNFQTVLELLNVKVSAEKSDDKPNKTPF